jgi:tetratricopeptide (TPR) repeat protein
MSLRNSGEYELAYGLYDRAESILTGSPAAEDIDYKHALIDLGRERAFAYYFQGRHEELTSHNVELGRLVEKHGTAVHKMEHLIGLALAEFREFNFLLGDDTVSRLEPVLELARRSGNPGRLAEAHFVLGFASLWADHHDEAVSLLGEATRLCERIGDMTTLTRASSYFAVALRRVGRVDSASTAAARAATQAESLESSYYRGHALATRAWVAWTRSNLDEAEELTESAISAWGHHELAPNQRGDLPADYRSLGTEFAWMIVWPAVATKRALGRQDAIPLHLDYLRSPWERAMHADLAAAAEAARLDPSPANVDAALTLARAHRLL